MAVSRILPSGGANDFNLNITGATTAVTFDKEYAGGSYSITSSAIDITLDFYAYNAAGTLVGYTSTKAFTASSGFNKIVVLGGSVGDVIGFTFKKTFTTSAATAEVTAGPVVTSVSPSAAPNVDSTVTITGANFASNVTVTFTGTGYTATAAKNIVRSSSTSLIVTRPDNFPISGSPYTITVSNPGVTDPVGSSVNILANSVTAGVSPVWSTAATLPAYTRNSAYTTTVVATDADAGATITYSVISNTLPTGLTFATTSGVISGTATVLTSGGITVRATDSGGNFVDRAFTIANVGANAPVWVTTGSIASFTNGVAYSAQLSATDDSGSAPTYTLASGTLPTGITLSSSGLLSGTPSGLTGATLSFTFTATDANGTATTSGTITANTTAYAFTAFTFTSAGTTGRNGPTLGTLQSAYSATAFTQNTSYFNVTTQGIQRWAVPGTGTYRIQCVGAAGGNSMDANTWGYGASMQGDFSLTGGEIVNILVGQGGVGAASTGGIAPSAGGGGGSFVWRNSSTTEPLIAAGGGAGGTDQPRNVGFTGRHANLSAVTGTTAQPCISDSGVRGTSGSIGFGGTANGSQSSTLAGAGAGYKGNGAANGNGVSAQSPLNGGVGGPVNNNDGSRGGSAPQNTFEGGFGGGGGAAGWYGCSGGGGGYSGGSAGDDSNRVAGGGGASYNAGSNQTNTAGFNTGGGAIGAAGYVVITKL